MKNAGIPKQQKTLRNGHVNRAEQFAQDPNEDEKKKARKYYLIE
jgi:hypothetical protein